MAEGTALLDLLELEPVEVDRFRGRSLSERSQRVFGGQVAAQALVAAGRTVQVGSVHSLHSYFLLPGDPATPILYEVDRIRDGRSFTTRRVVAIQQGRAIFNLHCSFHRSEQGVEHQEAPPQVAEPESLAGIPEPLEAAPEHFLRSNGLEVRFATRPPWERLGEGSRLGAGEAGGSRLWLRFASPLPPSSLLHAAVMTFASDLTLMDTILGRHGGTVWDQRFVGASLDHCMWFHRPARADEWLLYAQHSPVAHGARGFALGTLYSRRGELVASVAQEGLVRFRRPA